MATTEEVQRLMKRCQIGVGGRGALDAAHDIMAECYGTLGALVQERDRLRKAINEISQAPHNPDAFLVAGHAIYDIEIAPCTEIRERAKEVSE